MLRSLAAFSAAMAIAAGAFGAHGAGLAQAAEWLKTGAFYQLIHAVAIFAIGDRRGPAWLLLGGSLVFSATLYLMAIGLPRWLGAITPLGGVLMIAGWICLAWKPARRS